MSPSCIIKGSDLYYTMFVTDEVPVGKFTVSVIRDDQYIGGALRRGQEWDGWMRHDIPRVYKPGTDILDIGGNIGWNALMFSDYGPVHSFEPLFHEVITKNVKQNVLAHPVTVHPYGLSSTESELEMYVPRHDGPLCNYGGASIHKNASHDAVPRKVTVKKLDDVYSGVPSFIKLDVEHHEIEVLKGARRILETYRPAIYVEMFDDAKEEISNFMKSLGYVRYERPEHNYLFICSDNRS